MYEHKTVSVIMTSMLERVPDTVDKREGSIIYDALAPAAVELANTYTELDYLLEQLYADTAEGEFLDRRAAERGLERKAATTAVITGVFDVAIEIGARFYCGDFSYIVISDTGLTDDGYTYQLQCEIAGADGNIHTGTLIPVEYIEGLTGAQVKELSVAGEDEEDDASLRQRYMDGIGAQAFGGNIADYKQKIGEIDGVGKVKVTPRAEPDDVVLITILSSNNEPPSAELIATVQTQVDPDGLGSGVGLAPIGHVVTVQGATAVPISITLILEFEDDSFTFTSVKPEIVSAIENYFIDLRENWTDKKIIVRRSQIEARVLDVDGIQDVLGVQINGSDANLPMDDAAVPMLQEVVDG